jgi:hypothetical protein
VMHGGHAGGAHGSVQLGKSGIQFLSGATQRV